MMADLSVEAGFHGPLIQRGTAVDETLESINRRLKENQWRITRCDPSPAYYVVRSPIQAGHGIEATEWMKGPNGLEPSVPLQIPVPEGLSPITETEDGF